MCNIPNKLGSIKDKNIGLNTDYFEMLVKSWSDVGQALKYLGTYVL